LHWYTTATGEDRAITESFPQGIGFSPDGETIYATALVGHVVRHRIVNFGGRPRP
jgi:sugar lactone lactonase YvrE